MDIPFLPSLHRPFNQPLKATKWVCDFIKLKQGEVKSSTLNLHFYLFLLNQLHRAYHLQQIVEYNGLPSKEAVDVVYALLKEYPNRTKKIEVIQNAIKAEREEPAQKQIYSTYKAASYYVNMAKDKLQLVSAQNKLTTEGEALIAIRSGMFTYSTLERRFFFKAVLKADFLLFISLCFFKRLSYEFEIKDYITLQFSFLDKYYHIKRFNFTTMSLANYNTVRSYWIDTLGILNKHIFLKPTYLNIILADPQYSKWHSDLVEKFDKYKEENFKSLRIYLKHKQSFEKQYNGLLKKGKSDLGFINLYDIKKSFKLSHEPFQEFLNSYYDQEKGRKHIFFSNIVNSIDRRKRFNVRGIPVLKIKIK
jgi:hypothetical protein